MEGMLSQDEINRLLENHSRVDGEFNERDDEYIKKSPFSDDFVIWEDVIEKNNISSEREGGFIMDTILLPELRKIHIELRSSEARLTDKEKQEKHNTFKDHIKLIMELSDIARKEGLLALEDAAINMPDSQEKAFVKEMIMLIIDGTDPKLLEKIVLLKYYSSEQDIYESLKNIMTIYGLLNIQAGYNPRLLLTELKNMIPSDVQIDMDEIYEFFDKNTKERPLNLEDYCVGELRIRENDCGYFEIKLADDILMALSNNCLQRVLRDVELYKLGYLLECLSGICRKHIFENLSERLAKELAAKLREDDPNDMETYYIHSEWSLKHSRDAARYILSIINKLENQGEIVISLSSNAGFFSIIMKQLADEEKSRKEKERDCEMLMNVIRNYKRYYLDN